MPIRVLHARQIYDSIGNETIEVDLITEMGLFRTGVPNADKKLIFDLSPFLENIQEEPDESGSRASQAVDNINNIIAPELIKRNIEVQNQRDIDQLMLNLDNTVCKLGADATMVVSMAIAKAGAAKKGIPLYRHISDLASINAILLPIPHFVLICGGTTTTDYLPLLEYIVMPIGADTFAEAYRIGTDIYRALKEVLEVKYGKQSVLISDNGGLTAPFTCHGDCMLILTETIKNLGYEDKVNLAFNANGAALYHDNFYNLDCKHPVSMNPDLKSSTQLDDFYFDNLKEFGVISVEDPFHYDDWHGWSAMTAHGEIQVIANDLTQCDINRCALAIDKKAANAITLKLSQCGTMSELIDVFTLLNSSRIDVVMKSRIGDTDDLFLADLAVGLAANQIHCGAPCRGEHTGKYNQILRIEQELGVFAKYAGKTFRDLFESDVSSS